MTTDQADCHATGPWASPESDEAWISCSDALSPTDAINEFMSLDVGDTAVENGLAIYVTGPHDTYHVVPDNGITYEDTLATGDYEPSSIVNTDGWDSIPAGWTNVEVWHVRACHPDTIVRRDARAEGEQAATRRAASIADVHYKRWRHAGGFHAHAAAARAIRDAILVDVNDSAIPDQSAASNATRVEHDAACTHNCRDYARACRLEGAHDERRSIAAWLRVQGGGSVLAERERHYARKFADAIERGEHQRGDA